MADAQVVNIVGHLDFSKELDLGPVSDLLRNYENVTRVVYEPSENHWLQSWFTLPGSEKEWYVSFYRSGVCMIVGSESRTTLSRLAEQVSDAMSPAVNRIKPDIKIRNVVAVGSINKTLDLAELAIVLGLEKTEYEPEQFPALIYRGDNLVYLIFSSGNIVGTGESDIDDTLSYLKDLMDRLKAETGKAS